MRPFPPSPLLDSLGDPSLTSPPFDAAEFKALYPPSEEDETSMSTTQLYRNAPLALYVRRTRLHFDQLSFDQAVLWWEGFVQWCDGSAVSERELVKRASTGDV